MTTRHDPFENMYRFFEQARRSMWDDARMGGDAASGLPARRAGGWNDGSGRHTVDTNVDVEETDAGFVVMADLPGFEKDDLSIRFDDGVLAIHGESEVSEEHDNVASRRSRRVDERLSFPQSVLEDEISASYHNGVLEITLPVAADETDDSHRIDIE
ncbi:Hsp20/alpha crystallin family protein [Haloarcula salina]|uniref:Hsp20/alpha crystallin family protein n=1 Tax=Haloarcula salina TaxID=1429914 RepID=UPI003C6F064C